MRVCEAPMLKRLPSDYMRDMYFTSQPLEKTDMGLLQATFKSMNAETQLLYASDWRTGTSTAERDHDAAVSKRAGQAHILGLNAARVFGLEPKRLRPRADDVLQSRPGLS